MVIRTIMRSVRQYRKESILSPAFMALEVVTDVLLPFLMASLIDNGINKGDMGHIMRMGWLLFGLALVALMAGVLSGKYAAAAATGVAANIRRDVFCSIQRFSFFNIDKFSAPSLITRLTTDISNVMMAYQAIIRQAVRAILMVSFAMFMAFKVNAEVARIFLFVAPALGLGLFLIVNNVHPLFVLAFKTYDKLNGIVQENLRGIRVVKSFVREETEKRKFEDVSELIYEHFTKAQKRVAFNGPMIQLCANVCMISISWTGARLIVGGGMTTGELMSLIAYIMQILMNLMMLSFVFVMIIISRASTRRVVEVINEAPDIQNPAAPVRDVRDGSIEFSGVNFSYTSDKSKPCLMDVNVSIAAGETIGIIGGTGSSKTSLVQLIPRLYDVTEGVVRVGGVDVRDYDIEALRESVSMVLQKNVLFSGTIRENLRWGNPDADDSELRHACRLARADEFIEAMPDGYDTHIEQGGSNVSGGQRQRLCIARALLKKPRILILDDSTSAVDTKTDSFIRRAFREEIPDVTKLIIAQRISSISDADRIIVMDGGRINAVGTHEELLAGNHIYQEVYQTQTAGGGDFDD